MRVLGLDLAQMCGWALLECAVENRVVKSGTLALQPTGKVRDEDGMPNVSVVGQWLAHAQGEIRMLVETHDPEMVVVEVPRFLLGFRHGANGINRASSKETIESMLRLSAVAFAGIVQAGALPFSDMRVECVDPNEWQDSMFRNVPMNRTLDLTAPTTKEMSKAAAHCHLAFDCDDHNQTDAALMALYVYLRERWTQGKMELRRGKVGR